MSYLIGIDLGTTGVKVGLFDENGVEKSAHVSEYPLYQPHNGWAEQDASEWWEATAGSIRSVLSAAGITGREVSGIGLSGQMHGLVMLDKNGNLLRRSIIWCDQRTAKECDELERTVGRQKLISITANPPLTGFTAAKLLWVRNNEPEIYEQCAHILLPKDYIRYKLTGEFATEVSDASGMQLMDVPGRCWSKELLSLLGIDAGLLAKLYESTEPTGTVSKQAAEYCGLCENTVVAAGAGDNAAAAIGMGIAAEGRAFTTLGTSGVVYAVSDNVVIDEKCRVHTLCASAPGKWTVMSCTQAAGLSLRWMRDVCCFEEMEQAKKAGVDPYVIMDDMAKKVPVGANRLLFLPYLMGERSPHPDPFCRGVFFGLSAMHTRADMVRAVMEGVAFSQTECVDVFAEMGVHVNDMMICGGGGRSPFWRQMLADLYRCDVSTVSTGEGPALGAAILAGVSTGVYSSLDQACAAIVKKGQTNQADPAKYEAYKPYYELYKKLYLRLKPSFDELAAL